MIRVAAAVLRREGRVLLCRRTRPDYLAGKWEFPGGKIEPGESVAACLERELLEELGIRGRVGAHVATVVHHYEALSLELIAHEVAWIEGELRLLAEHDAARWVLPGELDAWDLAAADRPIAQALVG